MRLEDQIDFDVESLRILPLVGGESRAAEYTGTKALMLAVLENGFRSYFSPKTRLRNEAERWISNPQSKSPFSFVVVCEVLGLEPDAVRSALRRLRRGTRPAARSAIKRSRPNVHRLGRVGTYTRTRAASEHS